MPYEVGNVIQILGGQGAQDVVRISNASRLEIPRTTAETFTPDGAASVTSIAASASSSIVKQEILNPPKSELFEIDGIGIAGGWGRNCDLLVKQPSTVDRFGTSQAPTGGVLQWDVSPWEAPLPISLFIVFERQLALQFTNNSPVAIAPEIRFTGWRYELQRMSFGNPTPDKQKFPDTGYEPGSFMDYKAKGNPHSIVTVGGFSS